MRLGAQPFLWKWVLFAWEWKMISVSKADHLHSFWNRGPGELGNGLLTCILWPAKKPTVNCTPHLWSTFGAFHYDCVFSTAKLFVQHCLECSTWKCYQISHLIATTEWHKSAGAHTLNCRQSSVCHAIQLRGVEKSEVANGHNENNSNN